MSETKTNIADELGFVETEQEPIRPSEAIYLFAGLLNVLEAPLMCGAKHRTTRLADIVVDVCRVNGFKPPRPEFQKKLKLMHPVYSDNQGKVQTKVDDLLPVEAICAFIEFLCGTFEEFPKDEVMALCAIFAKANHLGMPVRGWSERVVTPDLSSGPKATAVN